VTDSKINLYGEGSSKTSDLYNRLNTALVNRFGNWDFDAPLAAEALEPVVADLIARERGKWVAEMRDFADVLYGITGARWIADMLTSTLDRLIEGGQL
jgi:hypothetical protein